MTTTNNRGRNGRQNPCSICGEPLVPDECYDLILTRRMPKANRQGRRGYAKVPKYLPPKRMCVEHLYFCDNCVGKAIDWMKEVSSD